jgi:hypothetical protein
LNLCHACCMAGNSRAAVRVFEAGDPTIRSKRGFRYEILPMIRAKF